MAVNGKTNSKRVKERNPRQGLRAEVKIVEVERRRETAALLSHSSSQFCAFENFGIVSKATLEMPFQLFIIQS
jgi:hypothetical protein